MAANANTKLQISFGKDRIPLINIYSENAAELEAALTSIQDLSTLINSTQEILNAFGPAATTKSNMEYAKHALGAEEISADKQCKHGPLTLKSGTSARGPWKGWMCSVPKKDGGCDPIWVK